eukprot:CAMPEP_0179160816 /NCGR_PEP_ID=MMETSP0796-20121207/78668_1 /TAXON_ID=73915 /ORGANISM="Pyrodinium bahamense, Strain pbaha01" /LENGTH=50 /DNA_ID=CAMNT_0020862825 /DNA_START=138 /DNA_END=290 /DNA_ORIENTATION=-
MTSQCTHGEFTPEHAAWKVPVPHGRECQWETVWRAFGVGGDADAELQCLA